MPNTRQRVVAELVDLRRCACRSRMSTTCPAPNCWPRSRVEPAARWTAASAPATVPSQDSGGIEAGVAVAARLARPGRSRRAAARGGTSTVSHSASIASRCAPSRRRCARSPSELVDHLALLDDVLQAVGEPGGRRQPVAPGAAGLLVVALDRLRQVEVGDEAHVGLVDAHAERDGRDHDQAVLAQEPGLVGARGPRRPGPRGTAAPAMPCAGQELRRLLHRGARQAVDDARRRRGARSRSRSSSCLRGSSFGAIRYWMLGRSKLATKCRASARGRAAARSRRGCASVAVAVSAIRGTSGQRSCSSDSGR